MGGGGEGGRGVIGRAVRGNEGVHYNEQARRGEVVRNVMRKKR